MAWKERVKQTLVRSLDRAYEKKLEKKIGYDAWVRKREQSGAADGPESARDETVGTRSFVLFLQRRGKLNPRALDWMENYFREHEECLVLYGDEDVMGKDGVRRTPWYKPCWSPDLYLDCFYPGSVVAVRREFAERCPGMGETEKRKGFSAWYYERPEQVRERMDRLFVEAGGFKRGCRTISALPEILFHAEDEAVWDGYLESPSGLKLAGEGEEGLVSVIIPSRDHPEILKKCLDSLAQCRASRKMEIIVVDNGSSAENRAKVEALTQGMTYLYVPMEFNYSAMCNMGVEKARGNLLLFLNDDVEVHGTQWLDQMVSKALLPYVGAVGIKLYYPDSIKIQHAGVINMAVGPSHKMQFLEDNKSYYFGRNRYDHDCLAVTAACLLVERNKFFQAGGFKEDLKVAYNDVELGFCLWEAGYQNVVLNKCHATHHESLSRGSDDTEEKKKRQDREIALLYEKHPALRRWDPYYPELLDMEGLDSYIQPLYLTAGNIPQKPDWKELPGKFADYREDNCVMARVELDGPEKIQGYGVVLWDDNACYDRYLILEPESGPGKKLCVKLEGKYRGDLERNLPDQKNVGLGGFCVSRSGEGLAPGSYRIGMLAVHRVGRLKILGWSGKSLHVENLADTAENR